MTRTGHTGGFMLLEVILAVLLLSIGLFAVLDGLGRCIAAAASIQNYHVAETLLANKSYEFASERPDDIEAGQGEFTDYSQFSWARTFEPTEQEGLWLQTITVTWMEKGRPSTDAVVQYRYLPQKTQ